MEKKGRRLASKNLNFGYRMVSVCYLVMPCLNEESNLRRTCESLGFGTGRFDQRPTEHLVLVDNGSTDRTAEVAAEIMASSLAGTVHLVRESSRGFVPARSAGVDFVKKHALEVGSTCSQCLILQVDADADYSPGYTLRFVEAASARGTGNLFEAESVKPAAADQSELALLGKLDEFDERFFEENGGAVDFVVDDKMVGYFLSDWELAGGLQREFEPGGEYIYCGTSRMWIRMHRLGIVRTMVSGASCAHSLRKLSEGADVFSGSAGWPRGRPWKERWRSSGSGALTAGELLGPKSESLWTQVLAERERHLSALFVHLPEVLREDALTSGAITPVCALIKSFARCGIDLAEDLVPPTPGS